ncbi:MAG: hypothetical protein PHE36_09105 [Novosphingobium sp.]|nr:hypothetical protein [Novosphingobium sp.]
MALLVVALCLKALIPAGFMVSSSADTVLTVTVCSESTSGLKTVNLVIPSREDQDRRHSDGAKKDGHCAFTGLTKVAVGGADAILLALAFAFILVLGLAPAPRLPFRPILYLRPPLRGPPAAA